MLTQSLNHILLSSHTWIITPFWLHTQSLNHSFQTSHDHTINNHTLLMSFAHTITTSHPSILTYSNNYALLTQIPYTHNHSIIPFKHLMLTQSLNHTFQTSHAHTISQSHPSIVLFTHNHSITPFYHSGCTFFWPYKPYTNKHSTISQSRPSIVICAHNHFITSFYPHILEQLTPFWPQMPYTHNHSFQTSHVHTITQSYPLLSFAHTTTASHPSILTYSNNFALLTTNTLHTQSLNHIFQISHVHKITQSRPSFVLCAENLSNTSSIAQSRPLHAQTQVTTQSCSSIIQCSHNHSITSFQPLHTQNNSMASFRYE
jgi:hypothetical protein